jgi:hypothetical protein
MNRSLFLTVIFCFAIASAIASSTAEPLPLSLMPGPRLTLSRCAPSTITWFGSPPRVSAMILQVMRISSVVLVWIDTVTPVGPLSTPLRNASPTANAALNTGL